MSTIASGKDRGASNAGFKRDRAKKRLEQQIGRSFLRGVRPEMEALVRWCIIDKPAQIRSAHFRKSIVRLEMDWPFLLPEATGDSGDWVGTSRAVRHFREEFRLYLLEQQAGAKFANLLQAEFLNFLPRYFGAARFESLVVGEPSTATVRDHLKELANEAKERRLAGPHKTIIPKTRLARIRHEGRAIMKTVLAMQKTDWRSTAGGRDRSEDALFQRVETKYDSDRYPWMRYFRRCFRQLEPRKIWKRAQRRPSLADPRSWSAEDLVVRILNKKYLLEFGANYPLSVIRQIVKSAREDRH